MSWPKKKVIHDVASAAKWHDKKKTKKQKPWNNKENQRAVFILKATQRMKADLCGWLRLQKNWFPLRALRPLSQQARQKQRHIGESFLSDDPSPLTLSNT